jgi:hypothetical protein
LSLQSPEYVISSNGGEIVVWMLDVLLYQLVVNINCEYISTTYLQFSASKNSYGQRRTFLRQFSEFLAVRKHNNPSFTTVVKEAYMAPN